MKKKLMLMSLALILLVVTLIGTTYAIFTYTKLGTTENVITTGALSFIYTENTGVGSGISLTDALPVSDEVGKAYATENYVFDFKVEGTNTSTKEIEYEITLEKDSTSDLEESAVKVYLVEMDGSNETKLLSPTLYSNLNQTKVTTERIEKSLYYGTVPANSDSYTKSFRLKMWVDEGLDFESGNYNNKSFITTVNVYADVDIIKEVNTYKEAILNGTDPVLKDNLVPVQISNNGTVTKANISNEWYSYENKEWANAVILKDESVTYKNGETIPESNIESYFVWIPRYKYKIFDEGNYTGLTSIESKEQVIEIVFENKNTTPLNGTTVGDYLTHPAFTSFDSNGMWVGKFETGYDGATTTAAAQVNSVATDKIIIKPNVYSWRSMTVGNMFRNSYEYQRELDSHMMKNTEWGAVAYLQHSAFGSATSVRINNNSAYITGYSATVEPTLGYNAGTSIEGNRVESTNIGVDGTYTVNYLNSGSQVASTTGNYTGIYDMSGGAHEYVMGYTTGANTVGGSSGITDLYTDFFNDTNYTKYWDRYTSTANTNYNNRILGDTTGEMGPFGREVDPDNNTRYKSSWYKDYAGFAYASYPWFHRGGHWNGGTHAGDFAFSPDTGGTYTFIGYRIVLTPQ